VKSIVGLLGVDVSGWPRSWGIEDLLAQVGIYTPGYWERQAFRGMKAGAQASSTSGAAKRRRPSQAGAGAAGYQLPPEAQAIIDDAQTVARQSQPSLAPVSDVAATEAKLQTAESVKQTAESVKQTGLLQQLAGVTTGGALGTGLGRLAATGREQLQRVGTFIFSGTINVDARGAADPAAVRRAGYEGARAALYDATRENRFGYAARY